MKLYGISALNTKSNIYPIRKTQNTPTFTGGVNKAMASDLRVFYHHIYEYKKGVRKLILTTEKAIYKDEIAKRLEKENIAYKIDEIGGKNVNVYFGDEACVEVVKTLNSNLSGLNAEEDFILGILLGYDRADQCKRYLRIKRGELKIGPHPEE